MTIRRMIASLALVAVSLLGLLSALPKGDSTRVASPASQINDTIDTVSDLPVVGPLVQGAVRPH